MKTKKQIIKQFDEALGYHQGKDQELEADKLAMQFLSLVEEQMILRKMTKKALAEAVGTSPAFITQLFRANRRPSWLMLAKLQDVFQLKFEVNARKQSTSKGIQNSSPTPQQSIPVVK